MSKTPQQRAALDECIAKGLLLKEMHRDTGLGMSTISKYVHESGKHKLWRERRKKPRPEIDEQINRGLTLEGIGDAVHLSRERIWQYLHERKKHELWKQKREEAKKQKLQEAKETQEKRQDFFNTLCFYILSRAKKEGFAYQKAVEYDFQRQKGPRGAKANVPLEKLINFFQEYENARNSGIKTSIKEMANKAGICISTSNKILHVASLEPFCKRGENWLGGIKMYIEERKKLKIEKEKIKTEKINFLNFLNRYTCDRASREGFACQKAVEYELSRKRERDKNSIPLEKLVRFFQAYENALNSGARLSARELAEKTGFKRIYARSVLKRVGLNSLHKEPKYKIDDETGARALKLDMSIQDAAYFLNIPHNTLRYISSKLGTRDRRDRVIYVGSKLYGSLNFRTASQIYEAQDAGFGLEEISKLISKNTGLVGWAIKNRDEIEKKIISSLNILFNKEHEKPYL